MVWRRQLWATGVWAAVSLVSGLDSATAAPSVGPVGDRLVLEVNHVPYSQRQIEAYLSIKEALRDEDANDAIVVQASTWEAALSAFTQDAIVLQEAQRFGAGTSETIEKYATRLATKISKRGALASTLARLGIGVDRRQHILQDVLRVAAFHRSKDRLEKAALGSTKKPLRTSEALPSWLAELTDRAVVRRFSGADAYVGIELDGLHDTKAGHEP